MAKGFRPVQRDQAFLLPPDMREWLPEDHLVWFVLDTVDVLDISEFQRCRRRGGVGAAGYDPRMLLGLLIYALLPWSAFVASGRAVVSHGRRVSCPVRAGRS